MVKGRRGRNSKKTEYSIWQDRKRTKNTHRIEGNNNQKNVCKGVNRANISKGQKDVFSKHHTKDVWFS